MRRLFTILAVVLAVTGCNLRNKSNENMEKTLVIYYSQTGATEQVAQEIATLIEAETLRIDVQQPYNGTYEETIARCLKEKEANELPVLNELGIDINEYDTIFLGYPIWFGTYAPPMAAFVKENSLAGKKVIPFCTFGSGGLQAGIKDLKAALPEAEILDGYGVRNARIAKAPAEVKRFLIENGHLEGEVEKLPEYSEQKPVTEEEISIFNAACGDYQFPLGTPVSVGSRKTSAGTDYLYTVNSKSPDGSDVQGTIFVTVGNEADAKPEFTQVVR